MAWGLEARVPFLDKAFLEAAMNVDPKDKQFSKGSSQETDKDGCPKMEKYILRKAFDVSPDGKVYQNPCTFFKKQKLSWRNVIAVSSQIDSLAPEGAVLRRCRIFMD